MLISKLSNRNLKVEEAVKGSELREGIFSLIKTCIPDFKKKMLSPWKNLILTDDFT